MIRHKYTEPELKFTAVIYATRKEIVDHIRSTGKLPKTIPLGGFPTAMNILARKRGPFPDLTESEQLVFDAILREKRLPAGGTIFIPRSLPIYALEANQIIEVCPPPRTEEWE